MKNMLLIPCCLALMLAALGCEDDIKNCDLEKLSSCTVSDTKCEGNSIVMDCTNDYKCKMKCTEVCAMSSNSYTGTCSRSYQDQVSSTGDDVCWCM